MTLTDDKITAIFCFVDDLLKAVGHRRDGRRWVRSGERGVRRCWIYKSWNRGADAGVL